MGSAHTELHRANMHAHAHCGQCRFDNATGSLSPATHQEKHHLLAHSFSAIRVAMLTSVKGRAAQKQANPPC